MISRRTFSQALAGVTAASFLDGIAPAIAQAKPKLKVELDWAPIGSHAGLHLAAKKGWFDAAGLEVDVVDGRGSTRTIQAVTAGQTDIGWAHLGTMAAGIANGMPITSIACIIRSSDYGIMVPAESPYRSFPDLKGKRIANASAGGSSPFLDPYIRTFGLTPADFNIVNVDPSVLISTYTSGGADACVSTLAFFLPIVDKVRPSRGFLMSETGLNPPAFGFVVRKPDVSARADDFRRFLEVNRKAWDYIVAGNQDEAVDAVMSQRASLRLDRSVVAGQLRAYLRFLDTPATKGKPIGWQAESDWAAALKVLEEVKLVTPGLAPADFFTNQLVQSA